MILTISTGQRGNPTLPMVIDNNTSTDTIKNWEDTQDSRESVNLAVSGMENCADMDNYQNWAWNDLNCETAQANIIIMMVFSVALLNWFHIYNCVIFYGVVHSYALLGFVFEVTSPPQYIQHTIYKTNNMYNIQYKKINNIYNIENKQYIQYTKKNNVYNLQGFVCEVPAGVTSPPTTPAPTQPTLEPCHEEGDIWVGYLKLLM